MSFLRRVSGVLFKIVRLRVDPVVLSETLWGQSRSKTQQGISKMILFLNKELQLFILSPTDGPRSFPLPSWNENMPMNEACSGCSSCESADCVPPETGWHSRTSAPTSKQATLKRNTYSRQITPAFLSVHFKTHTTSTPVTSALIATFCISRRPKKPTRLPARPRIPPTSLLSLWSYNMYSSLIYDCHPASAVHHPHFIKLSAATFSSSDCWAEVSVSDWHRSQSLILFPDFKKA